MGFIEQQWFTLWSTYKKLWKNTTLIGKSSINGTFSIAFCMFTGGIWRGIK
jgi:hypothetical protein